MAAKLKISQHNFHSHWFHTLYFLTVTYKSIVIGASVGVIILVVLVTILSITHYYIKKRNQSLVQSSSTNPIQSIVWKQNDLYESKQSLEKSEGHLCLPDWLKDRSEMIFSKASIVKGKLLGKGQFGNVYKGKLHQGNAV